MGILYPSVLVHAALERHLCAVGPLGVLAVVVDGVAQLHGLELAQLLVGELVRSRRGVPRRRAGLRAGGAGALANLKAYLAVLGDEGGLAPISLDAATLRRPVLRRPDAGEPVHRTFRRVRHALFRVVADFEVVVYNITKKADENLQSNKTHLLSRLKQNL